MTGNLGKITKESIELCINFIKCFCINNEEIQKYDQLGRL